MLHQDINNKLEDINKTFIIKNDILILHFLNINDKETWCREEIVNSYNDAPFHRKTETCQHCLNRLLNRVEYIK